MKYLALEAKHTPRERGRVHGETFRELIAEVAAIRVKLCTSVGRFPHEVAVLEMARQHLPVLERFDPRLFEELVGIAEGARLSPEHIVVLNHYTDLRDIDPPDHDATVPEIEAPDDPDDCSAIFARTPEGAVLGQTWDMHGSAMPYVMILHVPESAEEPAAFLLSITGCLGMAGLSARGVGITINNLNSNDAGIGVVWPALVRRALREESAAKARDVILTAPLGSGHHYLVASRSAAFGIETSGTRKAVAYEGKESSYFHTNHCLVPEIGAVSRLGEGSTTLERYAAIERSLGASAIVGAQDLFARLGSHDGYPKSVCSHMATPEKPHAGATCGAIVMNLDEKSALAAVGCVHSARPQRLVFEP